MGIDSVDAQFRPKKSTVELECANCSTAKDVSSVTPLWFNANEKLPLCKICRFLYKPTDPHLLAVATAKFDAARLAVDTLRTLRDAP